MPVLASGEIETHETREVIVPAMSRGVHGQGEVTFVFQEGDSVPGKKGLLPPLKIFSTGLVDEYRKLCGRSQTFCGKNSTSEESPGPNNVSSIEELASQ